MKKYLLIPLLMLMMASCAAQTAPQTTIDLTKIHNDTLVTCVSKLDKSTIEYLKSQRTDEASKYFADFVLSNVIDVNGKHWVVNQTEWQDYACIAKSLP